MSNISTDLSSYASIGAVIKTASVHTNGNVASYFLMYVLCFMSFAYALPFKSPFIFSFKNINEAIAFCLISLVISLGLWGMKVCILCRCESSFLTAFPPLAPSSFIPILRLYCVIILPKLKLSLSFSGIALYPWVWMSIELCW